jgi:hypothetical protein
MPLGPARLLGDGATAALVTYLLEENGLQALRGATDILSATQQRGDQSRHGVRLAVRVAFRLNHPDTALGFS